MARPDDQPATRSPKKPAWPRRQSAAAWMTVFFAVAIVPAWAGYRHTWENLGASTREVRTFGMLGYYESRIEQSTQLGTPPVRTWRIPPAAMIATLGWTAAAGLIAYLGFRFLGRRRDSGAWCDVCLYDLVGVEGPNCPECGAPRRVSSPT